MTDWNEENVAAFKEAFAKGGMRAARRVFPELSEKTLYKRGSLLGIQRRPEWTEEELAILRKFWRRVGPRTLKDKLPGRTHGAIYGKAKDIRLPMGLPQGYVSIAEAARRAGWSPAPFLRELRKAGVRVRRYIGGKAVTAMRQRPHLFVEPDEAEVVAIALAQLENVTYGARARGVCAPQLRAWLKAKGHKPPRRDRAFWRVESARLNEGAAWLQAAVNLRGAAKALGVQPQHVTRCLVAARAEGHAILTIGKRPVLLHLEDLRPHVTAHARRVRDAFLETNAARLAGARADALARRREAKSLWRWGRRISENTVVLSDAAGREQRWNAGVKGRSVQCACCLRPIWRRGERVWKREDRRVCKGCVTRLEEHGHDERLAGDAAGGGGGQGREAPGPPGHRGGGERPAAPPAGPPGG